MPNLNKMLDKFKRIFVFVSVSLLLTGCLQASSPRENKFLECFGLTVKDDNPYANRPELR
jgi:outer membrane biogenesis lipoprotein LolB